MLRGRRIRTGRWAAQGECGFGSVATKAKARRGKIATAIQTSSNRRGAIDAEVCIGWLFSASIAVLSLNFVALCEDFSGARLCAMHQPQRARQAGPAAAGSSTTAAL